MMQRVLIVGFGSIGQRHLRIVRAILPGADVRVLRGAGKGEAEEANGCFTSLDQALAFEPQAAIIASPAPFHVDVALVLAQCGCHLLVEKPLSDRAEGVPDLLVATRVHGVVLQVGYNLRFLPSLVDFRQRLLSGSIGRILSIRCETGQHLETWRPGTDYRTGVSARRELGGGVLLELSHEFDYLRWIFGDVSWVSAFTGRQGALDIDVEDSAHLLLGMGSGASGAGSAGPVAALSLDFLRRDATRRCLVIGETGSLAWDGIAGTVRLCTPERPGWEALAQHTPERDQTYRDQWRHFLDCVERNKRPLVSGSDGLAVLEMVKAARRSAAMGCARVEVGEVQGGAGLE